MNGFFITLTKKPKLAGWKAMLHEEMHGAIKDWPATSGATPDEALSLQKERYGLRLQARQETPRLVSNADWPKASGKITRFVEVNAA